jgi:hypothetical protein
MIRKGFLRIVLVLALLSPAGAQVQQASAQGRTSTVAAEADLSVTINGPGYVPQEPNLGGISTYIITVTNHGPDTATNVTAFVQGGLFSDSPCSFNTCDLGTLAADGVAIIDVTVRGSVPKNWGNVHHAQTATVSVSGSEADPQSNNNSDSDTTYFWVCGPSTCPIDSLFCDDNSEAASNTLWGLAQIAAQFVPDVITYYLVRDQFMALTPDGQHYVDLYYAHAAEIQSLMYSDLGVQEIGLAALESWEPNLQALVEGEGDSAVITNDQVTLVDSFLNSLSSLANPQLVETIAVERNRLPPLQDFVGLTMNEARDLVLGDYVLYLPAAQK